MIDLIKAYIKHIDQLYQTGVTTEHSFRGDLQKLLEDTTGYKVINEQKRIDCGAPDLALYKNNVPYAYFEAKDLEVGDLDGRKKNKEQFDRYKASLNTIVFTDYLDFHLYEDGSLISKVELAYIDKGHIRLNEEAVPHFISMLEHLKMLKPQTISSPVRLAKIMASKARMLADAIEKVLANDTYQTGSFWNKLRAFKEVLNNDLNEKTFADLYAQTIAYGLFAARLHDDTPDTFTRQEAANLIPKSNPFLRQIFQQLAGYDINDSIAWIVDDLVNIFAVTDVKKLRKNFGKEMEKRDPMIHFYEDFLSEYDPASKKKFGVYYTPQPVVEFIVRAVDDILKTEFNLPDGLADKSKVEVPIKRMEEGKDVETITMEPRHRVQILDPATGTGTFLAEVVRCIKEQQQPGIWPKYVDEHLLPRIHGFELMMAPYTIAHLKLDMLINWWGEQKLEKDHDDRVQIYLTNSLSQAALANKYLLAEMIAREANEANNIKHNTPVMVVIGNPPYSGESTNTGEWIMGLMEDYKKEPNSDKRLNEKNPKWINNDYCKFIRMAQDYVDRKGEGVVAYISANSFLDNPTFRGMRWSLLSSFDKIYIVNLHGNAKPKPEKCPDGSKDENVFDITVGTSINIFIKSREKAKGELAKVYYSDLFGIRDCKYSYLSEHLLRDIPFAELNLKSPYYFFIPQDLDGEEDYKKGFKLDELMELNGTGIVTKRDELCVQMTPKRALQAAKDIIELPKDVFYKKYNMPADVRDWRYDWAQKDVMRSGTKMELVVPINYRLFDTRYIYYTGESRGFMGWPVGRVMGHLTKGNNIAFISKKGFPNENPPIFVSDTISDFRYWSCSGMQGGDYVFPLYLYPSESELGFESERKPNLDDTIWWTIENWVKYGQAYKPQTQTEQSGLLDFNNEQTDPHFLAPEDIFDYIYGVLHSPLYREKYKEFLKVDFPRIPYPKNADEFEHFKECGRQLRELHLMHNVPKSKVTFDIIGNNKVESIRPIPNKDDGYSYSIYINDTQYFAPVPIVAWDMYIGGYQPAQKWLKDRKGRVLSTEEIEHYEKIIRVLLETKRIMDSIDSPEDKQLSQLQRENAELRQKLQAQQSGEVHYHINHIDTLTLGDNVENKFTK